MYLNILFPLRANCMIMFMLSHPSGLCPGALFLMAPRIASNSAWASFTASADGFFPVSRYMMRVRLSIFVLLRSSVEALLFPTLAARFFSSISKKQDTLLFVPNLNNHGRIVIAVVDNFWIGDT